MITTALSCDGNTPKESALLTTEVSMEIRDCLQVFRIQNWKRVQTATLSFHASLRNQAKVHGWLLDINSVVILHKLWFLSCNNGSNVVNLDFAVLNKLFNESSVVMCVGLHFQRSRYRGIWLRKVLLPSTCSTEPWP